MIKFYYDLIIKNIFKFIFFVLLFASIQICYDVYETKKNIGKNDLCGYYDKLITYNVEFYEYLRAINDKLERQEEFNYISNINATFYSFVLNLEQQFYKNIINSNIGEVTVIDNKRLSFKITVLNSPQKIEKGSKFENKIEKNINDIFLLTYDEFAFESIFSLAPIPRVKFIIVKSCNPKTYNLLDKIFFQLLISAALSFCLLIFKTQLVNSSKRKKKI